MVLVRDVRVPSRKPNADKHPYVRRIVEGCVGRVRVESETDSDNVRGAESRFRTHRRVCVWQARSSGPAPSSNRAGTIGSPDRWQAVRPPATQSWNRSSHCPKRTSWTVSDGRSGRTSGWPSQFGSKGPTTAGDTKGGSANSHPPDIKTINRTPPTAA